MLQLRIQKMIWIMILFLLPFRMLAGECKTKVKESTAKDVLINVLIFNEQTKAAQALMDAMTKYWTCCKYEFIDMQEMKSRINSQKFFLIYDGLSTDENNPSVGRLSILKYGASEALSSKDFRGSLRVEKNRNTGSEYLVYDKSLVSIGVRTYLETASPDFYVALLNLVFKRKFVDGIKKRCFDGQHETESGMFMFDNFTAEDFKGKTLLIDEQTKKRMMKVFKTENILKTVVSKTTMVPEDKIILVDTDEFCKAFLSERDDVFYVYTYYNYVETDAENKTGLLWMAPNIINYKGQFVASLNNYKKLKKKHAR
jgi:hypothetical protein